MILHKCITLITKTNLKVIQTLPKQILAHEPLPVNYSLYIPSTIPKPRQYELQNKPLAFSVFSLL